VLALASLVLLSIVQPPSPPEETVRVAGLPEPIPSR
jgi:hypothetical protein